IDEEPPSTLPRDASIRRLFRLGSGSVWKPQSCRPRSCILPMPIGIWMSGSRSRPPASISSTRACRMPRHDERGSLLSLGEAVAEAAERAAGGPAVGGALGGACDQRLAGDLRGMVVEAHGPALRAILGADQHLSALRLRAQPFALVELVDDGREVDPVDRAGHHDDARDVYCDRPETELVEGRLSGPGLAEGDVRHGPRWGETTRRLIRAKG